MFGWAKPVPVAAWKFRDPRRGMMVVAAAGPAMNFFLAWLGALALHATPALPPGAADLAETLLFYFILTNLVLGPVQPAADPAAGRRADRGRAAAAVGGAGLGAAGAGRHRDRHAGRVHAAGGCCSRWASASTR